MNKLLNFLRSPSVENINVDDDDRLEAHRYILSNKEMLQQVFREFHHLFRSLDSKHFTSPGDRIELGAGIAPVRDSFPNVLATDVVESKYLDRCLNAENMDLPNSSVGAFYGQNCFHHFPNPDLFFKELDRTLSPGGGAILIEPYFGPFASFLYKRLFKTEGFDMSYPSWTTPVKGPMNGANQALSYIVFFRDRKEFERKYPNLKIVETAVCENHLKYLLSGGLNFIQLAPNWSMPLIDLLQKLFSIFNRWTALHHIIVIKKEIE